MAEEFEIEGGVLTRYNGSSRGVIIPAAVQYISDWAFADNRAVNLVDMSQSQVSSIGSHAFQDCVNLVTVKTPENLRFIGGSAFRGCVSLSKIYLPQSIDTIEECAFMQCDRLSEVQIGMNAGEKQRHGGLAADGEYLHNGGAPLSIGDYAFNGCPELIKINLTARLHKLGVKSFSGCSKLSEVIVYLEDDTYISDDAFLGCNNVVVKYRGSKKSKKWWESKFAEKAKIKIKYNF